ncbi:MAG: hypothetical protein WA705_20885 [Candidatus Ozemobacteraceae bacterium]
MLSIEEMIAIQREFDSKHKGKFAWDEEITEKNVEALQYLLLATLGELGEAANITKKVIRGDLSFDKAKESISEEIVDVLIYSIKMLYQLKINVGEAFKKKVDKNRDRFKKYEK